MDRSSAHHKKMTEGSVASLIVRLGIPTTVSMLISNIYNLVDTYFVGTLGTSQQGAIGILFTLQAIIQAFAFLLGHGAGTHLARKLAEKDNDGATRYSSTSFFVGLGVGLIIMAIGLPLISPFMRLLGSSETILPYAKEYGLWVLLSAPFLIASLVLNNLLRYEGMALFAMIGIGSGAILNIFGDFIFIQVMGLGVFGAGMSTGISQTVSFVILVVFFILKAQSKLNIKWVARNFATYRNIVTAGFPSLIRQGLASISGAVLNNLAKPLGDAAVAAMSVVNRFSNLVMCVGLGVGQGFQPVAAYNYSIQNYKRVRNGCLFTLAFTSAVIVTLSALSLIFSSQIVTLFNPDPQVIEYGNYALVVAGWSLMIMPISVVANLTFQAVRKHRIASILSTLRNGLVFIPMIFFLVEGLQLGFTGIALAQPLSDVITSLISLPFLIVFLVKMSKLDAEKSKEETQTQPNE